MSTKVNDTENIQGSRTHNWRFALCRTDFPRETWRECGGGGEGEKFRGDWTRWEGSGWWFRNWSTRERRGNNPRWRFIEGLSELLCKKQRKFFSFCKKCFTTIGDSQLAKRRLSHTPRYAFGGLFLHFHFKLFSFLLASVFIGDFSFTSHHLDDLLWNNFYCNSKKKTAEKFKFHFWNHSKKCERKIPEQKAFSHW